MINYFQYIKQEKIIKKSNIQINIPTFNSYEVTKKTICKLYNQKNTSFDILLIDNDSEDYKKLIKDFPKLNYVLLKENTGSGGAQRIGAEIALKYSYEYVIFTDNDAILLDEMGLSIMKNKLDVLPQVGAIVPRCIESNFKKKERYFFVNGWPFHYVFVKSEVLKKISLHNFNLFLYSDDGSLTSKIASVCKILVCQDVTYYHYAFSPKSLENFYNYYYLRGLLIIIFKEKGILLRLRINFLFLIIYKMLQMILYSVILFDFSYLTTIFLGIRGSLNEMANFSIKIPKNKYFLKEVDYETVKNNNLNNYIDISNRLRLFFPLRKCYIHSNYLKSNIYFKLVKNLK